MTPEIAREMTQCDPTKPLRRADGFKITLKQSSVGWFHLLPCSTWWVAPCGAAPRAVRSSSSAHHTAWDALTRLSRLSRLPSSTAHDRRRAFDGLAG